MTETPILKRNAYTPSMLAKELEGIVTSQTIRREINRGNLAARRVCGKIVILRDDAEQWLRRKSALDRTGRGAPLVARWAKTGEEIAAYANRIRERRASKRLKPTTTGG